ncbi:dihydrodipicolinate synthase family protein [Vibrio mangrovi]|uniref:4-hydroxy-tetrahydrodipicolinate synthase n=1 Tax=Vibrio mangrovi TaxID=474394 RepID=A0A1Y6IWF3_9VIBR|nr:dihydrodipicolinate synthase family protein [Vibrio mangrovi]MDW6003109.1 dihydrodipicolinate synthase family protein [Vibrio mangrovi]SMS01351.1 4-hydroxy-tetrahydrodipicolinate synthase [Vibrio mangrovi]
MNKINGIIPVMITPLTEQNEIDYPGLERLIDWYIDNGADALFAVCQSSEMQFLSLPERVALSRFVVDYTAKRIPVISSGHISTDIDMQLEELTAIAQTGIDALVLVTNRLDPNHEGTDAFLRNLDHLLESLPPTLPLGLYECPAPYRRLLSDEELRYCAETGRFVVLKDVSCDLETVTRRVGLVKDTPLAIINANAAIAFDAMKAGSKGFSGVFTNFHPDLYHWLYHHHQQNPEYAEQLAWFLSLSAVTETLGYPKNAKIFHQRLGTFSSTQCRSVPDDVLEKYWGLDVILTQIASAGKWHREQIAAINN